LYRCWLCYPSQKPWSRCWPLWRGQQC
jgi:hypothetical protein